LLVGCPEAAGEKSEAAAVSRAVNSLREAENEKKPELLGALRATECSAPDVCRVRSACLVAYELHVETLSRVRGMAIDGGDANAVVLDQLKQDLDRARDLGKKCTDAQGEMIRRYKL
jgi:hypothetical protein